MKSVELNARDWGLLAAAVALILDQGSKMLMLYGLGFAHMGPGRAIPILPFFNLVMVWNPGVSYGLFPASGPLGTALLALFSIAEEDTMGWWRGGAGRRARAGGRGRGGGGARGGRGDRRGGGK